MKKIKLSIIVPVYNVEKYVKRCVDSILNQNYKNIELILVDDGSTDNSGIICDSYKNDLRVKVFHQKNQGVSSARNLGIEISNGNYLLFLDADDWLADKALSKLIYNCNDADMIMFGAYNYIELENNNCKITKRIDFCGKKKPFLVCDKYKEIFDKSVVLWNKMIKREIVSGLRFDINIRYGEDAIFLCKVLNNVNSAYIIPEELYYYYNNRVGNVVSAKIDRRSLELIESTKEIYDVLVKNDDMSGGFKRISVVANEVLAKIPLTSIEIKNSSDYLKAIKNLLRYPSLKERISYYLKKDIKRSTRCKYFLMQLQPFYMYCKMLKRGIF